MRRSFLALIAIVFALVGASPVTTLIGTPRVIVYPFSATGSTLDREASSRLATIVATQMAIGNDIVVVPPKPGVERKDFLEQTRAANADYYIAGFISPLGNGASIVEQVVSAQSGIVVFSNSAQLQTYADAAGQGDVLRAAIVRHAARNLGAYDAPPQTTAATPAPSPSSGSEANLSKLGKLFGRKKQTAAASPAPRATSAVAANTPRPALTSPIPVAAAPVSSATPAVVAIATPTPMPAPSASASPTVLPRPGPTRAPVAIANAGGGAAGTAILAISGTADADRRTGARDIMLAQFAKAGRTAFVSSASAAPDACTSGNASGALTGSLDMKTESSSGLPVSQASFLLTAYDCAGNVLYRKTFDREAGGPQSAIIATDRAVTAAVAAFLNPPGRRH